MRVVLESNGGDVLAVHEPLMTRIMVGLGPAIADKIDELPENQRYQATRNFQKGKDDPIPFNELCGIETHTISTWMMAGDKNIHPNTSDPLRHDLGSPYPIVISPRFQLEDKRLCTDSILIRTYVTLPTEDFERLGKIRFDFWDPRANN
jgi:hypothetical protein